jgi:hypothetical protein
VYNREHVEGKECKGSIRLAVLVLVFSGKTAIGGWLILEHAEFEELMKV